MKSENLDRLLRAAASSPAEDDAATPPFGFETRVIALARAQAKTENGNREMVQFLRWVAVMAFAVFAVATAGAYQQFSGGAEDAEGTPLMQAYGLADAAIEAELTP